MFTMKCSEDGNLSDGGLQRFGRIELNPAACVLNYDQVPLPNKGFLHIKRLLMGNGPVLSVKPAPEFTFLIYATSMGNHFKGEPEPINLVVENEIHRAVRGGAGSVNAMGNYAPLLKAQVEAKANGFFDVLYLDCVHKKYVEETSTSNIFIVKDKILIFLHTLEGTILRLLPGVTRKSIIEIACSQGYQGVLPRNWSWCGVSAKLEIGVGDSNLEIVECIDGKL